MPGGHRGVGEIIEDIARRKLKEDTLIDWNSHVWLGTNKARKMTVIMMF